MFASILKVAEARFEGEGITAVGAFLFLRFIGPALVAPEAIDVVTNE